MIFLLQTTYITIIQPHVITKSSCIYNILIYLIFTEIRERVRNKRVSVIGDFPLHFIYFNILITFLFMQINY